MIKKFRFGSKKVRYNVDASIQVYHDITKKAN
jgi:hypothetical protein